MMIGGGRNIVGTLLEQEVGEGLFGGGCLSVFLTQRFFHPINQHLGLLVRKNSHPLIMARLHVSDVISFI
jgi:hypothetical protein